MGTGEISFIAVGCGFRLKSVFLIDFRCKFSRNFGPQFMIKYSINKKIAMAFLDQKHLKIDAVKEKNVRVLTSNGVHVFGVRCLIQILCNRNPTSVIFVCIQYLPRESVVEQVVLKIGSSSKLVFGRQEWSREIRVVERHWWETSWGRSSSSRSRSRNHVF